LSLCTELKEGVIYFWNVWYGIYVSQSQYGDTLLVSHALPFPLYLRKRG